MCVRSLRGTFSRFDQHALFLAYRKDVRIAILFPEAVFSQQLYSAAVSQTQ